MDTRKISGPPEVKGWPEYKDYNIYDTSERKYLNSGMILSKKDKYVEMLDIMTEKLMFGKEIKHLIMIKEYSLLLLQHGS